MDLIDVNLQLIQVEEPSRTLLTLAAVLECVIDANVRQQGRRQFVALAAHVTRKLALFVVHTRQVLGQSVFVLEGGLAVVMRTHKRSVRPMRLQVVVHARLENIDSAYFTH